MTWLSFLETCFFLSCICLPLKFAKGLHGHLYNICVALVTDKMPSKNVFCCDSGFVLFVCKSWVIQSFEVCSLGWMTLSPGYLVPPFLVWTMQPVLGKQSTCTGFLLSLKYPVNVSKSLCTHGCGCFLMVLPSQFIYCVAFRLKTFLWVRNSFLPFVQQGWISQVMCVQSR